MREKEEWPGRKRWTKGERRKKENEEWEYEKKEGVKGSEERER